MALKEYRRKRDFGATPEPAKGGKRGRRLFVVQLHHATARHYDFRLELDGVLKSWAVPKGPSFDPAVKRLAVEVEDHPISYAGFEGDIPEGHYGAGHVDVYDSGTWEPQGGARAGLAGGELKFVLHGDVLRGSWVLVRTRKVGKQQQWLLIKHADEYAGSREADDFVDAETDRPISRTRRRRVWRQSKSKQPRRATAPRPARERAAPDDATARSRAPAAEKAMPDIAITHPERVVFAALGITKGDVADYYRAVAPQLLPEIARRPLSVVRCPDGIAQACFFQKHLGRGWGDHVHPAPIREKNGKKNYMRIDDAAGVLELVQMNVLEFHPWGALASEPDRADRIVFDLDPHAGVAWRRVVAAARAVRKALAAVGLDSFVRTSGGKGLHVVVPLAPAEPWEAVRAFARAFAETLAAQAPDEFVAVAGEAKRKGKIFIDWLRNSRGATSVTSWSLRARPGAPVAVPLRWEELGRVQGGNQFDLHQAKARAARLSEDPWRGIERLRQRLPGND